MSSVRCVIIGGGGHARVLIDALYEGGNPPALTVVDADRTRWGGEICGIPIVGDDEALPRLVAQGIGHFAIGVGGTADNGPRRRLFERALAAGLVPLAIVHPRASVSRWAQLGPGCQLLAGAIVNAQATLGANVIVNSGAIVEHDCRLGSHVHVASGARATSGVRIGDGAHVGAGATLRQLVAIGEGAVIGAGAVVIADVEAHGVVGGVPARPLRRSAMAAP